MGAIPLPNKLSLYGYVISKKLTAVTFGYISIGHRQYMYVHIASETTVICQLCDTVLNTLRISGKCHRIPEVGGVLIESATPLHTDSLTGSGIAKAVSMSKKVGVEESALV